MSRGRRLVLGSGSATRREMLTRAGLTFDVVSPEVDEDAVKADWTGTPEALAIELGDMKALAVSRTAPDALVIAADQVLELDGWIFSKPGSAQQAANHLQRLAGHTHLLHTAMSLAINGQIIHRVSTTPRLTMPELGPDEIADYIRSASDGAWLTVGGYQVEGPGIRLFSRIDGDWHSILGLPLLDLLAFLRDR